MGEETTMIIHRPAARITRVIPVHSSRARRFCYSNSCLRRKEPFERNQSNQVFVSLRFLFIMARSSLFASDHDESESTMEADPLMRDDEEEEEEDDDEEKQIQVAAGLASGVLGL